MALASNLETLPSSSSSVSTSQVENVQNKDSNELKNALTLKSRPEYNNLPYKVSKDSFLLMSSIRAPYFRPEDRAPIDLCCVVDESGSMQGERIALVKETLTFVIKNLESDDRFAIVGYSDSGHEVLPLTKMDDKGKKQALEKVNLIHADGGTALCNGLLCGLDLMRARGKNENKSNTVASLMLFTDGEANVGYKEAKDIIRATIDPEFAAKDGISYRNRNTPSQVQTQVTQAPTQQSIGRRLSNLIFGSNQEKEKEKEKQELNEGKDDQNTNTSTTNDNNETILPCTINTFGFGSNHNASLLQALAEHGRGMYTFIENTSVVAETFAECLGGLISIVAQNIKLKLELNNDINDVVINKCLSTGYTIKVISNKIYELTIPDIQSEESRDIVFDIKIPALSAKNSTWKFGNISITYNNIITKVNNESLNVDIIMDRSSEDSNEVTADRDYDLDLQYNRILVGNAMKSADDKAQSGDLENAKKILINAQKILESSKSSKDPYTINLVNDLKKTLSTLTDRSQYESQGSKMMKMNAVAHNLQRSTHSTAYESQSAYANVSKAAMISKFKGK